SFGAGGALTADYTYGLGLVSQVNTAGTSAYYDFNNIGSSVGVTGSDGTYVDQYSYLPFGQTTTISATVSNPFTFVGEAGVMNDGSGLFSMGARDYDAVTGRFVSNDPIGLLGGDTNIRRYAGNNPTNLVDPAGLCDYQDRFGSESDGTFVDFAQSQSDVAPRSNKAYEALILCIAAH